MPEEKFEAKVIADFRITLPVDLRRKYGLRVGDKIWFVGDVTPIPIRVAVKDVAVEDQAEGVA